MSEAGVALLGHGVTFGRRPYTSKQHGRQSLGPGAMLVTQPGLPICGLLMEKEINFYLVQNTVMQVSFFLFFFSYSW